jgi:hypothetical protein
MSTAFPPVERRRLDRGLAPQLPHQVHRLHRDLCLFFPPGLSSSRRCARARLSRERTVPIGSSSASATLRYERSSHAKSRSASPFAVRQRLDGVGPRAGRAGGHRARRHSRGCPVPREPPSGRSRAAAGPRRAGASATGSSRSRTATAGRSRATRRTSCAARTRSGTARRPAPPRPRRPRGGSGSAAGWPRGGRRPARRPRARPAIGR